MGQGRLSYDLGTQILKGDPELELAALQPAALVVTPAQASPNQRALVSIYNRLGGLIRKLADRTQVDPASVLAVWLVESAGIPFVQRRAPVRVDIHELFDVWGRRDREKFDNHFRFGGHNQQPGQPWENQEYRTEDTGNFSSVHHNQNSEYAALTLAQVLASEEIAFSCTSIGGCQIPVSCHRMLGYDTPREMYEAFQESERYHVLGFFDLCSQQPAPKPGDLTEYLKARDWNNFARYYIGDGPLPSYVARLKAGYEKAKSLLNAQRAG